MRGDAVKHVAQVNATRAGARARQLLRGRARQSSQYRVNAVDCATGRSPPHRRSGSPEYPVGPPARQAFRQRPRTRVAHARGGASRWGPRAESPRLAPQGDRCLRSLVDRRAHGGCAGDPVTQGLSSERHRAVVPTALAATQGMRRAASPRARSHRAVSSRVVSICRRVGSRPVRRGGHFHEAALRARPPHHGASRAASLASGDARCELRSGAERGGAFAQLPHRSRILAAFVDE